MAASPLAAGQRRLTARFVRRLCPRTATYLPVQQGDALPQGLFILPGFVSEGQHDRLAAEAGAMLDRRAAHSSRPMDLGRRCVEFGPPLGVPRSLYEGVVEELFVKRGLVSPGGASPAESASIDYLAINEYTGGGGIESHVDTHTDCEQILSLSLLEDCVMELRRAPVAEEVTQPPRGPAELRLLLPRASLLVMREEARWSWAHGIPFGGHHEFCGAGEASRPGAEQGGDGAGLPRRIGPRRRRLSLTFLLHPPAAPGP